MPVPQPQRERKPVMRLVAVCRHDWAMTKRAPLPAHSGKIQQAAPKGSHSEDVFTHYSSKTYIPEILWTSAVPHTNYTLNQVCEKGNQTPVGLSWYNLKSCRQMCPDASLCLSDIKVTTDCTRSDPDSEMKQGKRQLGPTAHWSFFVGPGDSFSRRCAAASFYPEAHGN